MTDTEQTDTSRIVEQFFQRYASALLARDAKAIAEMRNSQELWIARAA